VAAIAAAQVLATAPALAQDASSEADACFTAAERAQPLMKEKRFREARADLEMCARDVCPRVARTDCRDWLSEVAREQPSIVIAAHEVNPQREVRDVTGVRAIIDGGITIDKVDAAPISLDPGRHRVRIERTGLEPLEQNVEVREGEKSRVLSFYWQTAWVAPAQTDGTQSATTSAAPTVRPTPASVYVLGALGLAAAGVGTYLEVSGLSKRSSLYACKPSCSQSSVDDALSLTRGGDVTLGVSAALFVGAAVIYIARPSEPAPAAHGEIDWLVAPTQGGVMAGLYGSM
jgi:hypothetical protein